MLIPSSHLQSSPQYPHQQARFSRLWSLPCHMTSLHSFPAHHESTYLRTFGFDYILGNVSMTLVFIWVLSIPIYSYGCFPFPFSPCCCFCVCEVVSGPAGSRVMGWGIQGFLESLQHYTKMLKANCVDHSIYGAQRGYSLFC